MHALNTRTGASIRRYIENASEDPRAETKPRFYMTQPASANALDRVLDRCPHQVLSWVDSMLELRTVSTRLNEATHGEQRLILRIEGKTPLRILSSAHGPRISGRVSGIRPSGIKWHRNPEDFGYPQMTSLLNSVDWTGSIREIEFMMYVSTDREVRITDRKNSEEIVDFKNLSLLFSKSERLEKLTFFFNRFIGDIAEVEWPKTLTHLNLLGFNGPIVGVEWPKSLKILLLSSWSGTLSGARFPPSLELLTIDGFEDRLPLQGVGWESVKELNLGRFNKDMDGRNGLNIEWPPMLERLGLDKFDQDLEHVVWPKFLKLVYFGDWMNRPIADVMFPDSLEILQLGCNFDRSLDGVTWPKSLKQLDLGSYGGPFEGVVWPVLLEELTVDMSVKRASKVRWPKSLKRLKILFSDSYPVKDGKIELDGSS